MKFLTRKGYLIEEQGMTYLADTDPDLALGPLQAAACTYRIALGPRAGQKVLSLQTVPTPAEQPAQERCASAQGFSLHAEVCCAAHQRKKLKHLCPRTRVIDTPQVQAYLPFRGKRAFKTLYLVFRQDAQIIPAKRLLARFL